MAGHLHAGLLNLHHAALDRVLRQLRRAHGVGVAALDLLADLVKAGRTTGRGDLTHRSQRGAHLLLHLGLLELAEQLGAFGDLGLQHHRVLLDGLLGLHRGLQGLIVQGLEILDALLGGDQLRGEGLGGVVVLGGLGGIARGDSLIGQRQRLAHVSLQLLDIGQLAVQPHLQLTLVADDLGGLLSECLVLALSILNGLLDLHLGIGIFVDLGAEQRHQVLPRLDERIGHLCCRLRVSAAKSESTPNLSGRTRLPHPGSKLRHRNLANQLIQATAMVAGCGMTTFVAVATATEARRATASWQAISVPASQSTRDSGTSRAAQMALNSSLEASLRPRSTSER